MEATQQRPAWAGARVAVLGGDTRELEVIRNFVAAGCDVRTFGVVADDNGGKPAASPQEAVRGAGVVVTPVPGIAAGDVLFARAADEPIIVDRGLLAEAAPGAFFFSGRATPTIAAAGEELGIRFHHLFDDDELQLFHAIPTAEGAIAITVSETDDTIHDADALVVGYGRIGSILARGLQGLGARAMVAARRSEVRARAFAQGHTVVGTDPDALRDAVARARLLYNTAPAMVLPRPVLEHLSPDAFVMDLAAPPGGIDHEALDELGAHWVWARAQAGTAPRHSGHAQFVTMARILDNEYGT